MSKHNLDDERDSLFPDGYTGVRNGLREHVDGGSFTISDYGVYNYLIQYQNWSTGIIYTCASAIGGKFQAPTSSINDNLHRLRKRGYINYRHGDGKRGLYPILIDKAKPTHGVLRAYSLNAFASNDPHVVAYDSPDGHRVETVLKPCADHGENVLMRCGDHVLTVCITDLLNGKNCENGENGKDGEGRNAPQNRALFEVEEDLE